MKKTLLALLLVLCLCLSTFVACDNGGNDAESKSETVEKTEEWGNRKLAYPINDYTEGYYVYVKYTAPTAFPAELKRILNILPVCWVWRTFIESHHNIRT